MTDWFHKMPPLLPSSIAPVRQDKPPVGLFLILAACAVGVGVWWWL